MKRGQRGFGVAPGGGGLGFSSNASGASLSYLAEPPSFVAISDPNVIVSLKNVLKKADATKAKGLEDLIRYAQAHPFDQDGGVEEALLEIWTQIYARISIDNSKRVRELAHTLQRELLRSARKRMERHVPKIVGPWLAGLYDRDRVVGRAASDGLSSFLTTPEKLTAFWVKCQPQILDFAIEAIQESQDTLSDERSTTAEDAEAKYYRVVTFSLSLVLGLLQRVDDAGMTKFTDKYDEFFDEETVWKSIIFNDSAVRKTVCQLLFSCLDRKLSYGTSTKARQAFVTGGLKSSHAGSALEYVRVLAKLTQQDASFWTTAATDKKSPLTRLQAFISKGSQGSPAKFWEVLDQLLALIPTDALDLDTASKLLTSVKAGITNREEPRTNTSFSWKCFIDVARRSLAQLPNQSKIVFTRDHIFPLLEQFLFSTSDTPSIPKGPNALSVIVEAHLAVVQSCSDVVQASAEEWHRLGFVLCTNISGSLPEVSSEYKSSQATIAEQGRRWFGLVGLISDTMKHNGSNLPDQTTSPSYNIISQCTSLLESRNMKPFGAAQIIEYALSTCQHLFADDGGQRLVTFLSTVADDGFDKLATSASAKPLLSCLGIFSSLNGRGEEYRNIWRAWVEAAFKVTNHQARNAALSGLLSQDKVATLARANKTLQETLYLQALDTLDAKDDAWELLETAIINEAMSDDVGCRLGSDLVGRLSKPTHPSEPTLRMIEMIARSNPSVFCEGPIHTELVAQLLSSFEINDVPIAPRVGAILSILNDQTQGKLPVVEIIQANLEQAEPQSLSIQTLVSQAKSAIDTKAASWEDILPNTNIWMSNFAPLWETSTNPALSIMSSIGGAVSLPHTTNHGRAVPSIPRDRDGRSIPARMALYTGGLLKNDLSSLQLPRQLQIELLFLQCLAAQLASDQIASMSCNGLWLTLDQVVARGEAEDTITWSKSLLDDLVQKADGWIASERKFDDPSSSIIHGLLELTMKESREMSFQGTYSARILSKLLQSLIEAHGMPNYIEENLLKLENLKANPDTALLTAGLIGGVGDKAQSSKAVSNLCNRLVSDVAALSPDSDKADITLCLLSLTAQVYEAGDLPVASNRIVFAVRQVASWLENAAELEAGLCASICRALNVLLPCMTDVYGSYWASALQFCGSLWVRAAQLDFNVAIPFIHASIKLMKTLEGITEPNDDLGEALQEFSATKSVGLMELLRLRRQGDSQLLRIVDGMLCRELEKIPISQIPETGELFGLIASECRDVQTAAYDLLQRKIPTEQQQKSIDALLDKTDARLPDELLSLFLDPPTLEKFSDEELSLFPTSIRGYLLSWKLVFNAYASSQFKIRDDYTEHLKDEKLVSPFLDFIFDVLGHSAGQPLDLDREGIRPEKIVDYSIKTAEAETEEQSLHWLLVHLYYLTLKFIPGHFRAWYIDCQSKQTKIAVESWTSKYLSPIIVRDTLEGVEAWVREQKPGSADEKELLVKVSKAAREVTAGYEVDESQAAIVIKIPSSYPIDAIVVSSLNRVAVNERKWQSWIMTTQGAITLANGSIIDGLQVFKRNISAALQGQSECAICYSMISEDKRMPDKRCSTCSNLFHRTCLYKWFQTSNQNSCPLCRNPIDYLGADTAKRRQQ